MQTVSESRVKNLEKIARACGVLTPVVYRTAFADCTTTKQRKAKICQMLKDAGMHGIEIFCESVDLEQCREKDWICK